MKSTKVLLSILGVAVLSACSTVQVKDTSGVTATNRMFDYYLEQTKQAFNDLAEHEHTDNYHVNQQPIKQSVLNAASKADAEDIGNVPAVYPKASAVLSDSASTGTTAAIIAQDTNAAESAAVATPAVKASVNRESVARFIPLDDAAPAASAAIATSSAKSEPVVTQSLAKFTEQVSADILKQTKEGACLVVKGTEQSAQGPLAQSITLKAYTGSLEEVLGLVAKQIGYNVLPSAGLITQPIVITYSAECTQAKAAFLEIGSLAGGEIKVTVNEVGKTVQVRYPSGNTYKQ